MVARYSNHEKACILPLAGEKHARLSVCLWAGFGRLGPCGCWAALGRFWPIGAVRLLGGFGPVLADWG